jgi:hypothetical protein
MASRPGLATGLPFRAALYTNFNCLYDSLAFFRTASNSASMIHGGTPSNVCSRARRIWLVDDGELPAVERRTLDLKGDFQKRGFRARTAK